MTPLELLDKLQLVIDSEIFKESVNVNFKDLLICARDTIYDQYRMIELLQAINQHAKQALEAIKAL